VRRAIVLFLVFAACKDDKKPAPAPIVSASTPVVSSAPITTSTETVAIAPMPLGDGGACTIDVGPLQMDFKGPAAIAATDKGALVAGNDKGTPHTVTIENKKASSGPGDLQTSRVPCAIAKGTAYCPADDGTIKSVGKSRPGTKIAAAEIGGHAVVAFISERKTTEGMTQTAEVWSDDGQTQRLSEEGNGATFVDLAPRDGEIVSMMIDAHMGMTPVHARTMQFAGKLSLGADTVLMIAGNAEVNTGGALATRHDKGPSFALVPIAKDISAFGVVAIRVEAPPKVDAKTEWSLYENGLDPAPIAAAHDAARMIVARVRPTGKEARSPRVLELGTLDQEGKFTSLGIVATHGSPRDVAMSADKQGIWLAYTDQQATWVDHRVCP
jgi:hypothetical protein